MSAIDTINNLPDISFIDDITLAGLQSDLITAYQDQYEEISGQSMSLSRADPNRIILLAVAQYLYQGFLFIDRAAKMNFLKYSYGDYLDNLGALKGVTRKEAQKATVTVQWSLESARTSDTTIAHGTRVTADNEIFFELLEDATIAAGDTTISTTMRCTVAGVAGNGFSPGEITALVDSVAFISAVINTTESSGGSDTETDESLAERIYLAPESYSTAGSKAAYIFHAKSSGLDVGDVSVVSPSAGAVKVCFLTADGSLPSSALQTSLYDYYTDNGLIPLTDYLQVTAPSTTAYTVDLTYYIRSSDEVSEDTIKESVTDAVDAYVEWQDQTIGRDISPDELVKRIITAGAKRVTITTPVFTTVGETEVAQCSSITLTYGGLEDG